MIKKEEVPILNQLIKNLEDAFVRLKKAFRENDSETFNRMKREIIMTQRRISRMVAQK